MYALSRAITLSRRLGKGANVFLASAELAAVTAIEGKLPSVAEYMKYADKIQATSAVCVVYVNDRPHMIWCD